VMGVRVDRERPRLVIGMGVGHDGDVWWCAVLDVRCWTIGWYR
jgi:hypothetical protein